MRREFLACHSCCLGVSMAIAVGGGCGYPPSQEAPRKQPIVSAAVTSAAASVAPRAPAAAKSGACAAPSRLARSGRDSIAAAALKACIDPRGPTSRTSRLCGGATDQPVDLAAVDAGVLSLDGATVSRLRAIAAKGVSLRRRPRVFGLVGDSMTVSHGFMRALRSEKLTTVDKPVADALQLATEWRQAGIDSIIDVYRGAQAQSFEGEWRDSFAALRAARVGARAPWALTGGEGSPLANLVRQLSPSVVVLLYGGNDAAYSGHGPNVLRKRYRRDLEHIVDYLERAGIVVIVNTLARHGDAPGVPNCKARSSRSLSDWQISVQTNALSHEAIDIACERGLPLIDLRHAMDAGYNDGMSNDGMHPSDHPDGSGRLTAMGLRCGYNIRNYVTLRMLKQVYEEVIAPVYKNDGRP